MLQEGHEKDLRERMEVARWVCFHIYAMNPYIKPPKAQTLQSYARFPWEAVTPEYDIETLKEKARITPEEIAELNRIFDEKHKKESIDG